MKNLPLSLRAAAELERRKRSATGGVSSALWRPEPTNRPQCDAYNSPADELFYGGSAGGGKTDLALGLAFTQHYRSLILRREATQLRGIVERSREIIGTSGRLNEVLGVWRDLPGGRIVELSGCKDESDKRKFQGRPHDLVAFDEATEFLESQVEFIIGWLRTEVPGQRCRVLFTGNPPTSPEGRWIVRRFAPWLDPAHKNPAAPGELRWFARIAGKDVECAGPEPFDLDGETVKPISRTFIPAKVGDNPYYAGTGYVARLQSMPEPLRSQMLYGDFGAGAEDDPWQIIPTAWIRAAMDRWEPRDDPGPMDCLGVDVAHGGKDQTGLSERHGAWFAPLRMYPGTATPDGQAVAGLIAATNTGGCPVNIDSGGVGASAFDISRGLGLRVVGINFGAGSDARDKTGSFGFMNLRAEMYWRFREALAPEAEEPIALPPDGELEADLAAPKWTMRLSGVQVESKDDIKKRIGRSPDRADAVVLAKHAGLDLRGWEKLIGAMDGHDKNALQPVQG